MLPNDISISKLYIAISLVSVIIDSKDTTTRFVHFAPVLALRTFFCANYNAKPGDTADKFFYDMHTHG